jgi:L-arabinose isomerase
MEPRLRPRIGLLPVGHDYYWHQYPDLQVMGQRMEKRLCELLAPLGDVVVADLADNPDRARHDGERLRQERVDLVLIFPFGYTPAMNVIPAVQNLAVPIRILNAHQDRSYDYAHADTTQYLHHEGVCCVPELAGALVSLGRPFRVRELRADTIGAAAARFFRQMNVGLIGQTYTHMVDMPIDEHRLLRATGQLLVRPEVEEIENAFKRVTDAQLGTMIGELRAVYDVDDTVTDAHLEFSARLAVAFDEVITRHDIHAFGFYWWGERELVTQLRAQAALAVSRLTALGRPGVTEGDVKSALAVKILDLLGGGGMFVEFFAMDFDSEFFLLGHDGPSNVGMAHGRPRLMHLNVHHGKSGLGLGIDFAVREGPVTLLNLTQFDAGDTFKLIYSLGEVIPGPVLAIGNPNCRVRVSKPLHVFMEAWCQHGPSHHLALGLGDHTEALETFAEAMGFRSVRV